MLYVYWMDGRGKKRRVKHGVLEIQNGRKRAVLYLQFPDFKRYTDCKVVCEGVITVTDHLTTMSLQNHYSATDHVFLCAYTPLNGKQETTLCQFSTITAPAGPVTTKVLLSKQILPEDEELFRVLEISREEIKSARQENRFRVFPLPFA